MKSENLKVYEDYGGKEAVASFLSGFAKSHPQLADWTVDFVYGHIISDKVLTPIQKAKIIVTILSAVGDSNSALKFHKGALLKHSEKESVVDSFIAFGQNLRNFENVELSNADHTLSAIAGLCALGDVREHHLKLCLKKAMEDKIDPNKIKAAIGLVCGYRGFPLAIAGAVYLEEILNAQ